MALAGAGDHDVRVSAALLYGSGNNPPGYNEMHCMNTVKLPKERRRYFSGEKDEYFGRDYLSLGLGGYYGGMRDQLTGKLKRNLCLLFVVLYSVLTIFHVQY